jgi:hypothetical protein
VNLLDQRFDLAFKGEPPLGEFHLLRELRGARPEGIAPALGARQRRIEARQVRIGRERGHR